MHKQSEDPATQPLAYSPGEAARAAGLGRTTIYKLIAEGRLRSRKIGSRTVIPADDVRSLIVGQEAA